MPVGFAERFRRHTHAWRVRHAGEDARLLAIVAGEAETPHVSSCARCQARLAALRAWTSRIAGEAGAIADDVFTPERLAAQKSAILRRLETAGRSARVIAFPVGAAAPVLRGTRDVIRWAAAAAAAGILVGAVFGRLLDTRAPDAPVVASGASRPAPPLSAIVSATGTAPEHLDEAALLEAALLEAAYDRVSIDSLRTIDDITPRAREVAFATLPGRRR